MAFRRRRPVPPSGTRRTAGPDEETVVQGRRPAPPPGGPDRELWPWLVALLVLIAVGGGLAAYFATRGGHKKKLVVVPHVVGFTESAALSRLRGRGFDTNVSRSFSNRASGYVVSQDPSGGAKVAKGRLVGLVVSKGPASVAVPNLVRMTEADAVAALTNAGLKADVVQVSSSQPVGDVIAQNPTAGKQASRGSSVRLNVSKGTTQTTTVVTTAPTTTAVGPTTTSVTTTSSTTTTTVPTRTATTAESRATLPDLVGGTLSDAVSSTKPAHVLVNSYPVQSADPGGTVVAQIPKAGQAVKAGSAVRVNVSVGTQRPLLPVPAVAGRNDEQSARQALAGKFTFRAVYRTATTAAQRGLVVGQLPRGGTKIRRWAQVILYVGR
jgi:beta-lactam-binding protein with PASTA domain